MPTTLVFATLVLTTLVFATLVLMTTTGRGRVTTYG